jgi:hypothetical protein
MRYHTSARIWLACLVVQLLAFLSLADDLLAGWKQTEYEKLQSLLSSREIQVSLGLSDKQVERLGELKQLPMWSISTVSNLLEKVRGTMSGEDRFHAMNRALEENSRFKKVRISEILNAEQWARLQAFRLKQSGLSIILGNSDLINNLGIEEHQLDAIRKIHDSYNILISPLEIRLGRQIVAGLRPSETIEDRNKEVESIAFVIQCLKADVNRDIEAVLTGDQLKQWEGMIHVHGMGHIQESNDDR